MFGDGPKFVETTPEFEELQKKASNYAMFAFLPAGIIPGAIGEITWGSEAGGMGLQIGLTTHLLLIYPTILKSVCKTFPKNYWIAYFGVYGSLIFIIWFITLATIFVRK